MKEARLDPSELVPSGGAHCTLDLVGDEGEHDVADSGDDADERHVAGGTCGDDLRAGVEQQGKPDAGPRDCGDAESLECVAGGCDADSNH